MYVLLSPNEPEPLTEMVPPLIMIFELLDKVTLPALILSVPLFIFKLLPTVTVADVL